MEQLFPIIRAHDHNREIFDFPGLNQSECFKQFVECASAAGHYNERVRVLNQERFAGEEIMHPYAAVEIGVGRLLGGQLDRAPDRPASCFLGTAVCRLHDARAAASYDSESE